MRDGYMDCSCRLRGWRSICSSAKCLMYVFFSLVGLMVYLYVVTSIDDKWYYKPAPCSQDSDTTQDLIDLADRIHQVLEKHKVVHFLCYGSLWGTLRNKQMLPWDPDLDICVLGDNIWGLDENYLFREFRSYDMVLYYSSRHGLYDVRFGKARAQLVLFEQSSDSTWFQRVGWERRIRTSDKGMKFPERLAHPPLTKAAFHNIQLPVPHEDVEILKYFYPDNWWIEVKPPGC